MLNVARPLEEVVETKSATSRSTGSISEVETIKEMMGVFKACEIKEGELRETSKFMHMCYLVEP